MKEKTRKGRPVLFRSALTGVQREPLVANRYKVWAYGAQSPWEEPKYEAEGTVGVNQVVSKTSLERGLPFGRREELANPLGRNYRSALKLPCLSKGRGSKQYHKQAQKQM